MPDFIAELLLLFSDIKHWFKKRQQRRYEKKHGLPKKPMPYPTGIRLLIGLFLIVLAVTVFFGLRWPQINIDRTSEKLRETVRLLEKEKLATGNYPDQLSAIIRNDPLRKNIIFDSWDEEFYYELSASNGRYILFSKGADRKNFTEDDIYP